MNSINDYLDPDDESQIEQPQKPLEAHQSEQSGTKKKTIETSGPDKTQDFKVLHSDGSLADLPDKEADGSGALDGTVGRGM